MASVRHRAAYSHAHGPALSNVPTFSVQDVAADGSCMFHALSAQLGLHENVGTGNGARALRRLCVQVLTGLPNLSIYGMALSEWVKGFEQGNTIERHARSLAQPHTWGSAIELAILATVLRRRIHVYVPNAHDARLATLVYDCAVPPADDGDGDGDAAVATPFGAQSDAPLRLLYVGGGHYKALFVRT